jgi:hypothetical protein
MWARRRNENGEFADPEAAKKYDEHLVTKQVEEHSAMSANSAPEKTN